MDNQMGPTLLRSYFSMVPLSNKAIVICRSVAQATSLATFFGDHDILTERIWAGMKPADMMRLVTGMARGEAFVAFAGPAALKQALPTNLFDAALILAPTIELAVHQSHYAFLRPGSLAIDFANNVPRHGIPEGYQGRIFAPVAIKQKAA